MADLHSAAGNESRCNCFGRPGTNPGCPVHGNHATPPAESAVDGPADPGAGETTSGPGWDRETIEHFASLVWACADSYGATGSGLAGQLRALLADRDRWLLLWQQATLHVHEMRTERDAARADLDAALVTIRGQLVLQRTARRDAAADMLDRAAAKLQAYSDVHSSTVAMLRRWAAEVRAGPPTDRT